MVIRIALSPKCPRPPSSSRRRAPGPRTGRRRTRARSRGRSRRRGRPRAGARAARAAARSRPHLRHEQDRGDQEEQPDRDVPQQVLRQAELVQDPRREEGRDEEGDREPGDDQERPAPVLAPATPPASTIGSTGSTHGETAVIRPATNARTIASPMLAIRSRRPARLLQVRSVGFLGEPAAVRRSARAAFCALAAPAPAGLLLAAAPASPAPGVRLRRGQVVGEGVCDLLDRAELLARLFEVVVRTRRVALGRGEERCGGSDRELLRGVAELDRVLLVPLAPGVREGTEQALRLGELRR